MIHKDMATFLLLPEDLLILLVEACALLPGPTNVDTLQQLRLAHPCFSYNKVLLNALFSTIILRPTGSRDDLQSIAPHVREVIFRNEGVLVLSQQGDSSMSELPRLAKENMQAAFSFLPNVYAIRVTNARPRDIMRSRTIRTGPRYWTNELEDALFRFALSLVNRNGTSLQSLYIGHVPATKFAWSARFSEFRELDLTCLKTLHFHPIYIPENQRKHCYLSRYGLPNIPSPHAHVALNGLLQKCAPTLEHLSLGCHALGLGDKFPPPVLPALKSLSIECGLLNLAQVTPWLVRHCPNLKKLAIKDVYLVRHDHKLNAWQPLFDAIRDHPKLLYVELANLQGYASKTTAPKPFEITYHTRNASLTDHHDVEEHWLFHALKGYMSGSRGWITREELMELREEVGHGRWLLT